MCEVLFPAHTFPPGLTRLTSARFDYLPVPRLACNMGIETVQVGPPFIFQVHIGFSFSYHYIVKFTLLAKFVSSVRSYHQQFDHLLCYLVEFTATEDEPERV